MALLSGLIRDVAITGRTDTVNAWFADRQGARWTENTIRAAFPQAAPQRVKSRDPAATLQALTELRERGVVTDAEFERLRSRIRR